MLKRILLASTFVAALGAAGLGISNTALARHGCYDDYGWYGHRTYYPAYYDYSPGFSYYRSFGHRHFHDRHHHHRHRHHHHGHHHHGHGGVHFSIGF